MLPDHGFSMSFEIDFDNPLIAARICAELRRGDASRPNSPRPAPSAARRGRRACRRPAWRCGGSLDNAVVVSGDRVLNDGGLRFADEFVRHKLLDAYRRSLSRRRADHRPFPRRPLGPCADPAAAGGAVRRPRGVVRHDDDRGRARWRRRSGRSRVRSSAPEPCPGRSRFRRRPRDPCYKRRGEFCRSIWRCVCRWPPRLAAAALLIALAACGELEQRGLYRKAGRRALQQGDGRARSRRATAKPPRPSSRWKASTPIRSGPPRAS